MEFQKGNKMNIGDNRWHRKYICDKCGQPIPYIAKKGIPVIKYYKCDRPSNPMKADFDLCYSCEKEFRKWLKTKPTPRGLIDMFPIYEEV